MTYKVIATEVFQRSVLVEATTAEEAHQRARDAWQNGEYTLGPDDFGGAEFHVVGESDEDKGLYHVEAKM